MSSTNWYRFTNKKSTIVVIMITVALLKTICNLSL